VTDASDTSKPDEESLTHDTVFSVLSNRRRRLAIYYLRQCEDTARVGDMATRLAMWENDVSEGALTYRQRKRVYTSLVQTHLPKLADSGFVTYERNRGTVSLTDRASTLDLYLELVDDDDVPWAVYYLGLSAIAGLVVGLAWAGVSPFAAVPDLAYAGLVTAALALSAGVHVWHTRQGRVGSPNSHLEPDVPSPPGVTADEKGPTD
jgi:hypothetical protein